MKEVNVLHPQRDEAADRLAKVERVARLMDRAFGIPGTRLRIGFDSIIGLLPGIGDAAALLPAAYIIHSAHKMGMPNSGLARMATNTAIDTVIGSIPLIGDIFDVGFKSNIRNVALLRQHLESQTAKGRPEGRPIEPLSKAAVYPTSSRPEKK